MKIVIQQVMQIVHKRQRLQKILSPNLWTTSVSIRKRLAHVASGNNLHPQFPVNQNIFNQAIQPNYPAPVPYPGYQPFYRYTTEATDTIPEDSYTVHGFTNLN
jgi:hypothetical protein